MKENLTKSQKAKAMVCFGRMIGEVEADPDPKTQDMLQERNNCKNCNWLLYCKRLVNTLK